MPVARLAAALVLGAFLLSGCGEANYGRSSQDPPAGPRALSPAVLHFKHPISLTALHRMDLTSRNHPDILTAGVRPGLQIIGTRGPGIVASLSVTYQTDTANYEFDLASGTVAKQLRVPQPVPEPLVIVKAPDLGGSRADYVTIVRELQQLVSRAGGGPWDWMATGGASPYELRQAAAYLQAVIDEVGRAGPRPAAR